MVRTMSVGLVMTSPSRRNWAPESTAAITAKNSMFTGMPMRLPRVMEQGDFADRVKVAEVEDERAVDDDPQRGGLEDVRPLRAAGERLAVVERDRHVRLEVNIPHGEGEHRDQDRSGAATAM
ncbi:hypothetical protein [Streptomyces sp. KL116D]|uniref:hypothetical protein n=1 Tax=Streptomyces sp. KL116D TaxID=3045152 RepID=UPI003558D6B6